MASLALDVHFSSDDTPVLGVTEFTSQGRRLFAIYVKTNGKSRDYNTPQFFCETADQVRAFVPSFVSTEEQAAMDAADEPTFEHCPENEDHFHGKPVEDCDVRGPFVSCEDCGFREDMATYRARLRMADV